MSHPATPVFVRLLGDLRHLDVHGVIDGHGIFHILDAIRRQLRLVHEAPGPEAGQLDEAPVRLEAGHGAPLDGVGRGGVRLSLSSAVATAAAAVGRRRRRGAVPVGHTADRHPGTNLFGAVDLVERRQGIGIGRDRMWDVPSGFQESHFKSASLSVIRSSAAVFLGRRLLQTCRRQKLEKCM